MAAPQEKTLQDLTGKWTMNRSLSDDVDGVLQIQGFSSLSRKAIAHAPVHLLVTHPSDKEIKIDQTTTASIPAVNEDWILDWEERESKDKVMGVVIARARWSSLDEVEVEKEWLGEGWLSGEKDVGPERKRVEAGVKSAEKGWTAHQIWGFAELQGSRYFMRRVVVRSTDGQQIERVKLVYDFNGPS